MYLPLDNFVKAQMFLKTAGEGRRKEDVGVRGRGETVLIFV